MRHGVLRRRSKRRPAKKVRFGKRTMKWGGDGSQDASAAEGGGGGGGAAGAEVANTPEANVDGFLVPPAAEGGGAAGGGAAPPMGTPPEVAPEALAAAPAVVVLPAAPGTPIGYRIWNVIFHSTILYIEAMSAQGVKIRVKQLCAFVWNMLGLISYQGNPLTFYISQSTTYFVVQLVAGANFAQEIFTDFIGGGIAYLRTRAIEAGGIALGILQPILAPVGVLINLTGRAAVNIAPLAPPVALIAWMGTTRSALGDVNWLTDTISNNAQMMDAAVRQSISARYAAAIAAMSNPGAFIPTAEAMDQYAARVSGGERALYLVRRAITFQTNIAASATQLATASAPTATGAAVTVFVYTRGGAVNTYAVLSPILEKMWGMSSSAIAQTISGLRGFAIRMYQGGTIVAQTIGWALDNVREVFIHSYRQIARGGSDSSQSSVASSVSIISADARGRIAAAGGGGTATSAKSAQAATTIISGIESAVLAAEGQVDDGNAEAMGSSAAEGEEIIGVLRAAAMLATPGTVNGAIGERIVQVAARGGSTVEASGTVMKKQLTAMANIDVDVDGGENPEKRQRGDSGSGEMAETALEELISQDSPLLVDEDRDAMLSPPTAGGGGGRAMDEEEEEVNAMLGAMRGGEEEGEAAAVMSQEPLEEGEIREGGDEGGRRTRRRRRNAAKAKRGKRKTVKKRKARRVNKKR